MTRWQEFALGPENWAAGPRAPSLLTAAGWTDAIGFANKLGSLEVASSPISIVLDANLLDDIEHPANAIALIPDDRRENGLQGLPADAERETVAPK